MCIRDRIGFGSIVTRGFNLGIDFTGGSIVDLTFENPVNVAHVRDVLKEHDMGNSIIPVSYTHLDVYKRQHDV